MTKIIPDYLERPQCDTIKGFFILLVFFSHFMQYVAKSGGPIFSLGIGQLVVACFLFYSGYGVMEQIKKWGDSYVRAIPKRRILSTLINFDVAVLVFLFAGFVLGHQLTVKQVLCSFIAWDSVGNSNWYIFVILLCYLFTYIVALCRKRFVGGTILLLSVIGVYILSCVKESWWYDTMLCFPAGVAYSEYKSRIETLCERYYPYVLCGATAILGILFVRCPFARGLGANVMAIIFAIVIVLITMRVRIRSGVLQWCGQRLFPIYIFQRLPMVCLYSVDPEGFGTYRAILYFLISSVVTGCIAFYYPRWQFKL